MQWLKKGTKWIIGDGQTIRVWKDHWIPGCSLRSHIVGLLTGQSYMEVSGSSNSPTDAI